MTTRNVTRMAALMMVSTLSSAAFARELSGVKMDDTITVGGTALKLNGMGMRSKKVAFVSVDVYVGGLYLTALTRSADEVLASDAPKALVMQFVREVGRGKLVDAWREGFANNAPKELLAANKAQVDRFLAFVGDVPDGKRVVFTYEPGKGSTITWADTKSLTLEGKGFADIFLSSYVGRDPPTPAFKNGLLSGK